MMIRAGQVLMQWLTPTGPEVFTRQDAPTDEFARHCGNLGFFHYAGDQGVNGGC